MAMISDIMIIGACVIVLLNLHWYISFPLIYLTYRTWEKQGGFIAWTDYKRFLKNAKRLGL